MKHLQNFKSFLNESDDTVDEVEETLTRSLTEYHDAMKRLQDLQTRFVKTPREKINEREAPLLRGTGIDRRTRIGREACR